MKVVVPKAVQVANYTKAPGTFGYTNIGDEAEWNVATPYIVGDRVIVDSLQSTFECVAGHTGTAPTLTMTTPWVRVGASNAWKPFDGLASSQLVGVTGNSQLVDRMRFRLTGMGRWSTICVLNTICSRVRVQFTDLFGTAYDQTINSVDTTFIVDAWTYCFSDPNYITDFVFDGIDGNGSEPIVITVTNDNAGVAVLVGEIIVGNAFEIGVLHTDTKLSLVDFSRKEANDYGDLTLVERAYSNNATFEVSLPADRINRVQGLVRELRATPCVWFPSAAEANDGLLVYGFPREWVVTYVNTNAAVPYAYATLEIEGLT
jgi:hypothetical protein